MITEEMIKVMQAYVDGKQIQLSYCGRNEWEDIDYPSWDWRSFNYRIKPEEKYRPYVDYHEMLDDFYERFSINRTPYMMPLIWLKHKTADYVCLVDSFRNDEDTKFFLNDKFDSMTYLDGSPVGKKISDD